MTHRALPMTTEPVDPQDVADAPELLLLETLETCLHALGIALILAYPPLADDYASERDGPTWRAAKRLSTQSTRLSRAIERYRKALRAQRMPPPDPVDCYF